MVKFPKLSTVVVLFFAVWCIIIYVLFGIFAVQSNAKARALFGMVSGLLVLWVVIGGTIMYLFRDPAKRIVECIKIDWRLKFILFSTLLALIEEAVTTTMTNMAPVFGVKIGEAYITASANYLDVILFHSVIVFIPMFIMWAWLLSKYNFKPVAVFILYGLTGILAESVTFGLQNLQMGGMWIFVYGLMVYLPAYAITQREGIETVKRPNALHYILAVIAPILLAIPVAVIVLLIHPAALDF
jgi:hypothetical protein